MCAAIHGSIVHEDIDTAKGGTRLLRECDNVAGYGQIGFDKRRVGSAAF